MATTYTLISSNVLTSSAASVTFSSIPATYTDLVLRWSTRDTRSSNVNGVRVQFGGVTSSVYSVTWLYADGGGASSFRDTAGTQLSLPEDVSANSTANTFNSAELYIPNYAGSTAKPISTFGVAENNSTTGWSISSTAGLFNSTSAVSSIYMYPANSASFVSGSSFYLYGIKNS